MLTAAFNDLQFAELYDSNGMFDKFNCCMSGDGTQIASGTYGNQMRLIQQEREWPSKTDVVLEASRDPLKRRHSFAPRVCSCISLPSALRQILKSSGCH